MVLVMPVLRKGSNILTFTTDNIVIKDDDDDAELQVYTAVKWTIIN